MTRGIRGASAVVGVAERHYRRGQSPDSEQVMTLHAILDACADAGVSPREIDGFVSYAGGSNDGPILGDALGIDELRWSNMMWGGGGGSVAAAI
ncbi:MAG TPA: transporter, partial [Gordonia sp. (in: high G+C Gram-positive bacteria)]|nr:transporter [Gordonia sp. (in: high G+C Gram-positive bacteria)]